MKAFFNRTMVIILLCLTGIFTYAQQAEYVKAIIYANNNELIQLANQGVCVDHGKHKSDTYFISDFSREEMNIIKGSGISYEVLLEDVVSYYQSRLNNDHQHTGAYKMGDPHLKHLRGGTNCTGSGSSTNNYPVPANFSLGSMGGYFTYQEFIDNIDSMAAKYPNLITQKTPIDSSGINYQTYNGYPVYWLKISDNPGTDEGEPEIMYSAVHHAREPASLSQLIYYMWYLLENYSTDPQVTYLVDNIEMYFVPMINPDGYRYNEQIQPGGGGMWRKNRRNNGGGAFGVDLNRNYAYQWGVSGASTDPTSDVYMGTVPFSEPETRAMRQFHFDHDFRMALNAHTYGNLLLFPFGYDYVQTPDHTIYQAYSDHMVSQNGFTNILSADLYPAAGDSDDWGYADDLAQKPKVMSMTPEIGSDSHGFWPSTSEITPICQSTMFMNIAGANITNIYGLLNDDNPQTISDAAGYLNYELQRLGMEPGTLTVTINPVGFGVSSTGGSNSHNLTNVLDVVTDSISYILDPGLQVGDEFQFELIQDNGFMIWRDTITKIYGQSSIVLSDNGSNLNNWTSSDWNTTTADYYSPSSSITDSPGGEYSNSDNTTITLSQTVDLSQAISATATFYCKWEIEDNYDYCQLMATSDGGATWQPVCGLYTQTGSSDQDPGEPLWDGFQTSWVQEEVDLSDFIGQSIQLRFRMVSDNFVKEDGFYFDDFEVKIVEDEPDAIAEHTIELGNAMPNPATDYIHLPYEINSGNYVLNIYDAMGKLVLSRSLDTDKKYIKLNVCQLPGGIYYYDIRSENNKSVSRKFVVVK